MKRISIVIAMACAAVSAARANTFTWSVEDPIEFAASNGERGIVKNANNVTAYLIRLDAGVTLQSAGYSTYEEGFLSVDELKTSIGGPSATIVSQVSGTDANGNIGGVWTFDKAKGTATVALLVSYIVDGHTYWILSEDTADVTLKTTSSSASYTLQYGNAGESGILYPGNGWTNPIPEPTSGLLLLVGAASLALRRRRA